MESESVVAQLNKDDSPNEKNPIKEANIVIKVNTEDAQDPQEATENVDSTGLNNWARQVSLAEKNMNNNNKANSIGSSNSSQYEDVENPVSPADPEQETKPSVEEEIKTNNGPGQKKKKDPAYIPKTGYYFEHDSREDEQVNKSEEANSKLVEPEVTNSENKNVTNQAAPTVKTSKETKSNKRGPRRNFKKKFISISDIQQDIDDNECWKHDRFDLEEQQPKSQTEIVKRYGFDIRQAKDVNEIIVEDVENDKRPNSRKMSLKKASSEQPSNRNGDGNGNGNQQHQPARNRRNNFRKSSKGFNSVESKSGSTNFKDQRQGDKIKFSSQQSVNNVSHNDSADGDTSYNYYEKENDYNDQRDDNSESGVSRLRRPRTYNNKSNSRNINNNNNNNNNNTARPNNEGPRYRNNYINDNRYNEAEGNVDNFKRNGQMNGQNRRPYSGNNNINTSNNHCNNYSGNEGHLKKNNNRNYSNNINNGNDTNRYHQNNRSTKNNNKYENYNHESNYNSPRQTPQSQRPTNPFKQGAYQPKHLQLEDSITYNEPRMSDHKSHRTTQNPRADTDFHNNSTPNPNQNRIGSKTNIDVPAKRYSSIRSNQKPNSFRTNQVPPKSAPLHTTNSNNTNYSQPPPQYIYQNTNPDNRSHQQQANYQYQDSSQHIPLHHQHVPQHQMQYYYVQTPNNVPDFQPQLQEFQQPAYNSAIPTNPIYYNGQNQIVVNTSHGQHQRHSKAIPIVNPIQHGHGY